jgi:hypothetical protein
VADKCGCGATVDIEAGKTFTETVRDSIGILAGSSMQKRTPKPGSLYQLGQIGHWQELGERALHAMVPPESCSTERGDSRFSRNMSENPPNGWPGR